MKNISLIFSITLCILAFAACNNKGIRDTKQENTTELSDSIPNCEVSSFKASLQSFYQSNSICSCFGGLPYCAIVSKSKDSTRYNIDKSIITSSSDRMPLYDAHIKLITEDLHNESAAQALSNIKQLFMNNNYTLSSPSLVQEYYRNFIVYLDFYKTQSTQIQDKLDSNLQGD